MTDDDDERIVDLARALSEAFWTRFQSSGVSVFDAYSTAYQPESEEELSIWEQLTSAGNHAALIRYLDSWSEVGVNDFAAILHHKLREESTRRFAIGEVEQ